MNRFEFTRPDQVTDVAGSSTVVASMRHLGLGTLVALNYDGASNLNLTYQNGGTGTAGDKYTGLDRFGRIIETIWIKGTGDVVQGVYGRNRSSGIDWRRDDEASSTIAMDALYSYDGLQQVTSWKRGNLSPSSGPPYTGVTSQKQGEDFTYDQTGNWLGDVSDNPNFTQSRTHDVKNQITSTSSDFEGQRDFEGQSLNSEFELSNLPLTQFSRTDPQGSDSIQKREDASSVLSS